MQHHHPFLTGPKDEPAYDDAPYPVYPVLPGTPQGQGVYSLPQSRYSTRVRFLRKLKTSMWLVILSVMAYCIYYLLPCGHLAVLGITLHP
ncbi:MAG: hypothetical protein ACJ8CB_26530 [Ktedonobacteraceae bacterium]